MITQERLKELLRYEPETGNFYWIARTKRSNERLAGCRSVADGYIRIGVDFTSYLAQRLAFLYMTGEWPEYAEHRNGIRSDNRWSNLRPATKSQDQANRPYGIDRGVEVRCGNYRARIKVDGKHIQLGTYKNIEDARAAYRRAADKYFGEFAHHNRPNI